MNRETKLLKNIDWVTILIYLALVFIGWLNIYAAVYDENHSSIFDITQSYGKQLMWIGTAFVLATFIMLIDSKFFTTFSIPIYVLVMLSLMAVLVFGVESKGARSWFDIGGIRIQPAEFGKFATCLAIANVISRHGFKMMRLGSLCLVGLLLLIPAGLIILQNDTGSALVYSSFLLVMYREGLHGSILLLCFIVVLIFILTLLYSSFVVSIILIIGALIAFLYYRQNRGEFYRLFLFIALSFALLKGLKMWLDWQVSDLRLLLSVYALASLAGIFFIYKRKMKSVLFVLLASWICIGASIGVNTAFEQLQPHQTDRIKLCPRAKHGLHFLHHRRRMGLYRMRRCHRAVPGAHPPPRENGGTPTLPFLPRLRLRGRLHPLIPRRRQHRNDHRHGARHRHPPPLPELRRFLALGVYHPVIHILTSRRQPPASLQLRGMSGFKRFNYHGRCK